MSYFNYSKLPTPQESIIFDIETDLIDSSKSVASQSLPIVLIGVRYLRANVLCIDRIPSIVTTGQPWLVGHNIGFDVAQLINSGKHPEFTQQIATGDIRLWDTSIAQYMLSNQTQRYPSLEETAKALGIEAYEKDSEVSNLIKSGISPVEIYKTDPAKLEAYLARDLELTEAVFFKQLVHIMRRPGKAFTNLVLQSMEWRHNTLLMSLTGMKVDTYKLEHVEISCGAAVNLKEQILNTFLKNKFPQHDFKVTSNRDLGLALYGGTYTREEKTMELTGELYKTGPKAGTPKTRVKTEKVDWNINGLLTFNPGLADRKVDEKRLIELKKIPHITNESIDFIDEILALRTISKYHGTYVKPLLSMAKANNDRIKCDYHHTATATSRLSSSKPNMQNMSK